MKLVKPGVYVTETDLSSVWFCDCCNLAWKHEKDYIKHTRSMKLKKIRTNLSS